MNKPVFRLKYSLAGAVYETVGYSGPHFSVITVNDESGVKLTLIPALDNAHFGVARILARV